MSKKKVLVVFGTRPEAIKMCPVVMELKNNSEVIETIVCVTGQHREMLDSVLNIFSVIPDYDLAIMKKSQTLFDVTRDILSGLETVLEEVNPDIVLVHGDTSTAFVTSLACFYKKIKIGHIEAGLRTGNIYSPYPEEFNRQAIGLIADFHFSPTQAAKRNLELEGKKGNIVVTGNTAIDALKTTVKFGYEHKYIEWINGRKLILLTAHRRENIGEPMVNIFGAIKQIVDENKDVCVLYPIHMNPVVRELANSILKNSEQVKIVEPLDVVEFHNIMNNSFCILTDSGGIQEEAPSLGKPVLVMRDTTERPEGVVAGTLKLVGTERKDIYNAFTSILNDEDLYNKMSNATNPYGDGTASKKIVQEIIKSAL